MSGHTTTPKPHGHMCNTDRQETKVRTGVEGEKLQTGRRGEKERGKERDGNPKNGTTF